MDARRALKAGVFDRPLELDGGIYRTLSEMPRLPLAQRSNFWPLTAALYEPLWRRHSIALLTRGAFSTAAELERLLSWLAPKAGERILDAGASAGLYARTLLRRAPGLEVHALDFSLPFLAKARVYAERDGVHPVLVHADVRALPYRSAVFDAIVCGGSANEFTDLPETLSEFARVLKPGGRLWLMYLTPAEHPLGRALQRLPNRAGLKFLRPARLEAQALSAGFASRHSLAYAPVALALFQRRAL